MVALRAPADTPDIAPAAAPPPSTPMRITRSPGLDFVLRFLDDLTDAGLTNSRNVAMNEILRVVDWNMVDNAVIATIVGLLMSGSLEDDEDSGIAEMDFDRQHAITEACLRVCRRYASKGGAKNALYELRCVAGECREVSDLERGRNFSMSTILPVLR